jgi:hypothetical protein
MSSQHVKSPVLHMEREEIAGGCPSCGEERLARYPVVSEGGWFMVIKCQNCLTSVERERWALLGPIQLLADQV